ncbi:MAG: metal-dependent hydrolase [Bryobacterales bacterium]|nr:metal-dependent hydrolase [Bryobacterales bacterium]
MDNLTHTLTGLMLSRAGLHRLTPRASLILMLAANAPDIDVVSLLGGTAVHLDWHRGFTHGFPSLPLMAALPVLAARQWRTPGAWIASSVGVLSHLLLDWTNVYGIRLLSPISQEWFRLDITTVIDPWIWLVLLAAVAWPALARLVSAEIGAKSHAGGGIAVFALAFLLLYNSGRAVLHSRAVAVLDSRVYQGGVPAQIAAFPHHLNPLRWRGVVELPGRWETHPVDLAREEFDPGAGHLWYQAQPSAVLMQARRDPTFQALRRFSSMLWWQQVQPPGEGAPVEVRATDLRFGEPNEQNFTATAQIDAASGQVREVRLQLRGPDSPLVPH